MKKNSLQSVGCTIIFAAGIIATIFGILNPGSKFLGGFILGISLAYLLGGWYYFKGYYPDGHPLLLFFIGFLYASVFMACTFFVAAWPLAKTMISIAPGWIVLQILITVAIRKKLPKEGFVQFLIEGGLMLIMIITLIVRF
jgi:hypothetical protein